MQTHRNHLHNPIEIEYRKKRLDCARRGKDKEGNGIFALTHHRRFLGTAVVLGHYQRPLASHWLARALAIPAGLLTDYLIQPGSSLAFFFYLILFAFVAGLTDLALLTNSLSWRRAPLPSVARYVGGTSTTQAAPSARR